MLQKEIIKKIIKVGDSQYVNIPLKTGFKIDDNVEIYQKSENEISLIKVQIVKIKDKGVSV